MTFGMRLGHAYFMNLTFIYFYQIDMQGRKFNLELLYLLVFGCSHKHMYMTCFECIAFHVLGSSNRSEWPVLISTQEDHTSFGGLVRFDRG